MWGGDGADTDSFASPPQVLVAKGKFEDATPLQKRALQIDESALTTGGGVGGRA